MADRDSQLAQWGTIELALIVQELDCVAGTRQRAPACSTRLIDPEVSRRLATNQLDEAIDCASDEDLYTMSDELCGPALDESLLSKQTRRGPSVVLTITEDAMLPFHF